MKGRLSTRAPGMRRPCQNALNRGARDLCHSGAASSASPSGLPACVQATSAGAINSLVSYYI